MENEYLCCVVESNVNSFLYLNICKAKIFRDEEEAKNYIKQSFDKELNKIKLCSEYKLDDYNIYENLGEWCINYNYKDTKCKHTWLLNFSKVE